MKISTTTGISYRHMLALIALTVAGCAADGGYRDAGLALSGAQEVPPVSTAATGTSMVAISADRSVSGRVTTSGVAATAAHIHEAPAGKNGSIIVPLVKTSDNVWSVPAGARLTDAQYQSFKAGNLYVNVHSAANKGGEIRAQLKP